jgi:uncharacterized membrane protein
VESFRKDAEWMTPLDDRILEILSSSGIVLSPAVIRYNLEYSRGEVSRRLSILSKSGLVEKEEEGYYSITSMGNEYLAGEFDARDLEEPD